MKRHFLAAAFLILVAQILQAEELYYTQKSRNWYGYLGNREQGLAVGKGNYQFEAYGHEDQEFNPLIQEIGLKVYGNDDSIVRLGIARASMTSLLKTSTLVKLNYSAFYKPFSNVNEESTFGLGYFSLPEQFSYMPVYNTKVKEDKFLLARFRHRFSNVESIFFDLHEKYYMNYNIGVQGSLAKNTEYELMEMPIASFSYLNVFAAAELHRRFWETLDLSIGYTEKGQSTSIQPLGILQNEEAAAGIAWFVNPVKLKAVCYIPGKYQVFRENYVYQDRRIETGITIGTKKLDIEGEAVFADDEKVYYKSSLSKRFRNAAVSCYYTKNMLDEVYGITIQVYSLFFKPKNTQYNYIKVAAADSSTQTPAKQNLNYNVSTLNALVQVIDTPEKVADYISSKLKYIESNNNMLGYLAGIYKPEEVFSLGGGNNTEQMGLASYALKKNGYETHLYSFATADVAHSYCVYKDKTTGKWNAMDYGSLVIVNADTEEEVIKKAVPNWLSLEIKDPETASTIKHIDSMTKWMLMDWFEKD